MGGGSPESQHSSSRYPFLSVRNKLTLSPRVTHASEAHEQVSFQKDLNHSKLLQLTGKGSPSRPGMSTKSCGKKGGS